MPAFILDQTHTIGVVTLESRMFPTNLSQQIRGSSKSAILAPDVKCQKDGSHHDGFRSIALSVSCTIYYFIIVLTLPWSDNTETLIDARCDTHHDTG